MNYRNEQIHDRLLISLTQDINRLNRLDLIGSAFGIGRLGKLEQAQRRQPFDVELTFSNVSVVIETKVDSDESGRWDNLWQTNRIFKNASSLAYLKDDKVFLFLTYGTSEYYTKPYLPGAASDNFKHIGLDCIINLVEEAIKLPLIRQIDYKQWLSLMRIEQEKRKQAIHLLKSFAIFRKNYLKIHKENDFPNNRFTFCAPELVFPALSSLATKWNNSQYAANYGRLALYPVSRMSPTVHDSILNFWEMWNSGKPALGGRIVENNKGGLYLEINEDFNLNLKLDNEELDEEVRNEVWKRLNCVNWPNFVNVNQRQYRQGTYVLYEFDFGFLNGIENMPIVAENLFQTVQKIVNALA